MINYTLFKDFLKKEKVKIVIENSEFEIPKNQKEDLIKYIKKIQEIKELNVRK